MRHNGSESGTDIEEIDLDELDAFCRELDELVREGQATLEDFGRLALAHQELARRRTQGALAAETDS